MDDVIGARLGRCYTGVVHDVMRGRGMRDFVLPHQIRPLFPKRALAGPIWTVAGRVKPRADPHDTLLAWTGLLAQAKRGHVVVCQPNTHDVALMGELSAETLKLRGVLGYVVDGACRDLAFIEELGFQVCFRHATPRDIVGFWMPERFDEPIRIGDVLISAGDYLLADVDGIIILPRSRVEEIVGAAETAIGTESSVRKAILEGVDPQEAYRRYGKF